MNECYFTPSEDKTSATICSKCGEEKIMHIIGKGIKVNSVIVFSEITTPITTPQKREAIDLLNRFRSVTDGIDAYNYDTVNKQCALITVDGILEQLEKAKPYIKDSVMFEDVIIRFWNDVKLEINNL